MERRSRKLRRLFHLNAGFQEKKGLVTVRGLRDAAISEMTIDVEKILADLEEFERVLNAASERGVRWHLAVDF
jgi:hypothetical protein